MEQNLEEMMKNEEQNFIERIRHLEKRVQQQDDELVCLKSTLADVLRRLQKAENAVQQQQQLSQAKISPKQPNSVSNNKIQNASNRMSQPDRAASSNSSNNGLITPRQTEQKLSSSASKTNLNEKSHVNPTTALNRRLPSTATHEPSVSSQVSSKDLVVYNKEAGTIKLYIHGRPIQLNIPSAHLTMDFDVKIKAPKEQLKLEWVYGYRGKDCRSNIYQLPTGEIVYFIAATIVLYNIDERQQRHYAHHTDDVKCLAIHPDHVTIASGQTAGHGADAKPHVRIWDSVNLTTIATIGLGVSGKESFFQNSICCLAFSKFDGGQQLCIIDDGAEKILSIWDWRSSLKLAAAKCYNDFVFGVDFHPKEKNLLISCGKQHIFFWSIDEESKLLVKKSGVFETPFKLDKPKYILCFAFTHNGNLITGDSDGNLLLWNCKQLKISRVIKEAHEGGVFSILTIQNENLPINVAMVTGGGKDGRLVEWSMELEKTGRSMQIPEAYGTCRFVTNGQGNLLVVGTTKNCILLGNFDIGLNCIVNGHTEELWGLTVHPNEPFFLTCGNDRNIFYWDILSHSLVWSLQLDSNEYHGAGIHCAHFHPHLNLVAIGFTKPKWAVLNDIDRKIIYFQIEGTEQIECIQFSPNGLYLACGSRDSSIYIYTVSDNGTKYSRIGRCLGHSSFIKHIDWSSDSQYLMSNSGDYEVLYWQATTCKQITNVQLIRDLEFATNNCTLTANTVGIWNAVDVRNGHEQQQQHIDGTDINASCLANSRKLLASVDDFGKVNLHAYPCTSTVNCEKRVYAGHSSHVTNAQFLSNDTRLITVGGNDMAIFEWSVIND